MSRAEILCLVLLAALPAQAQVHEADLLDEHADDTPREEDPISMGRPDELALPPVLPDGGVPTTAPPSPAIPPQAGPVLTAIPGVRELRHTAHVTLADGLARVDEELTLTSSARSPAEVVERLAVPDDARLLSLAVCDARGCRAATVPTADARRAYDDELRARPTPRVTHGATLPFEAPLPIARVEREGGALVVHAAPVPVAGALRVRVSWVSRAPMHGGVVRFTLPARGQDPRVAPLAVTVEARGLLAPSIDGAVAGAAVDVDPWASAELAATLPSGTAPSVSVVPAAGASGRVLVRATAGTSALAARDLVLLIDASPSTEGPARGRILPAVLALLAEAPAGSRLRAIAFAARTADVIAEWTPVERVSAAPLSDATGLDLGPATRLDVAVARIEPWLRDHSGPTPLVVVVGDGGVADDATTDAALARLRRLHVETAVVAVGDAPASVALARVADATDGAVVDAGREADLVARGHDDAPLLSRLAAVLARSFPSDARLRARIGDFDSSRLRAGEELVVESDEASVRLAFDHVHARVAPSRPTDVVTAWLASPRGPAVLAALDARDLAPVRSTCDRVGPAFRAAGQSTDASPVALAEPRCAPPPTSMRTPPARPLDGRGVPAETVRAMVHDRLIPAARGCFRADRHGRTRYSVRAVLSFAPRDREVIAEDVSGELAPPLQACLVDALDRLEVPRFAGTVVVHYPLRTEAEPEPEIVALAPGTATDLDRVIGNGVHETDVRAILR